MSTTINVRTDNEIKRQAQQIFESLGLDMTTAVNLFLRQTVRQQDLPFVLTTQKRTEQATTKTPVRPKPQFGCLRGQIHMADDFDAPMDDFREYM
ncbi:MAG: type II toxin-antitoxin system RelB/DinJ family antitoxin [Azoarcus sp.]|jgi:DNA-damage-inducible protein J|nr:type II toxin-antitoxin system RelB/DinJ family antitoxin [Azoarcus sp.]